ncbi:MAG: hypothetical protein J1F32_00815 [Erysipelotrichales bacterium]|nr:hypothetical protein [Erysipelotrichales bacterium]
MKNICRIKTKTIRQKIALYNTYAEICAPIKSIKHSELIDLIDCTHYLVDTTDQLILLLSKKINIKDCYFGSFKSVFDLKNAIEKGITKFVVASDYEMSMILSNASQIDEILLVINISEIIGEGCISRSGFNLDEIDYAIKHIYNKCCNIGISFHIQSPYKSFKNYYLILKNILPICKKYNLKTINLGGITIEHLEQLCENLLELKTFHLIVEPGNSLFSDAMTIETFVTYVDLNKKIIILNIGIYNGLLDCVILKNTIDIYSRKSGNLLEFKVYGPSSDNLDFLGVYKFSDSIKPGDYVIIKNCGIYALFLETKFYPCVPLKIILE